MSQPKVAIDITANDRTAKGARSAEKRLGTVPKHVSAVTRNQDRAMREGLGRSSRSALRTLGQVEQASARVFGGLLMWGVLKVLLAARAGQPWTAPAWWVYKYSLLYLALLFVAMAVDRAVTR